MDYGHDDVYGTYGTVGAFVNVGFELENLVRREKPVLCAANLFFRATQSSEAPDSASEEELVQAAQVVVNTSCEGLPTIPIFNWRAIQDPVLLFGGICGLPGAGRTLSLRHR